MTGVEAVAGALATFRLTKLVIDDEIAKPARDAVLARVPDDGKIAYLLGCPWCVSVWAALGLAVGQRLAPRSAALVTEVLAASAVSGLLATWT